MKYLTAFLSQNINTFPDWPEKLALDEYEWKKIIDIHNWTEKDHHEYETTIFYMDDDPVFTTVNRGSHQKVLTGHSASIKYIPDQKTRTYLKEMYTDNQLSRTKLIKEHEVPAVIDIKPLMSIHTHPNHNGLYSFFSSTDINSLLTSEYECLGLVTDNLWVISKSGLSPSMLSANQENMVNEITSKSIENPNLTKEGLALDFLYDTKLILYKAEFNNFLYRIN